MWKPKTGARNFNSISNKGACMRFSLLDQLFRAFLFLVFLLIITPVGLLLRTMGTDYMSRKWDRAASSYWVERKPE